MFTIHRTMFAKKEVEAKVSAVFGERWVKISRCSPEEPAVDITLTKTEADMLLAILTLGNIVYEERTRTSPR